MTDTCFICHKDVPDGKWDHILKVYLCPSCATRERNNSRPLRITKEQRTLL